MNKLKFLLNKQLEPKAATILKGKLTEYELKSTNAYELDITEWWNKCENGWIMSQLLSKKNKKTYLVCAEIAMTVLHKFEESFPNDNIPRLALEAAERFARDEITEEGLRIAAVNAYDARSTTTTNRDAYTIVMAACYVTKAAATTVVYWTVNTSNNEQESHKNSANIIRKHFPNVREVL